MVSPIMTTIQSWITDFFKDPATLVAFGIVIFTSMVFPLAVAYGFRLWRRIIRACNDEPIEMSQVKESLKTNIDGSFNFDVLKDLYHVAKEEDDQLDPESESESESNNHDEKTEPSPQVGPCLTSTKPKLSKIQLLKKGGQETPPVSQPQTPDVTTQLLIGKKTKSQEEEETVKALKNLSENGLHGKLATAQLRARTHKIEESMSDAEREKERQIKNEQLNSIFMMMQAQGEKFGVHDKNDLEEQLKLYAV
uniref:Matrix-remodeling-associated protein 7 helical domain-containing protein n=1 Tax=Ditylenchus dipsaci TaxID=166011 RepID=A0A915EGI4_9BILA